jgi:hypothetical protein
MLMLMNIKKLNKVQKHYYNTTVIIRFNCGKTAKFLIKYGGQSYILYSNIVHFFNTSVNKTSVAA